MDLERNEAADTKEFAHSGETKRPAAMAMMKLGWLRKRKKLGATGLAALAHTRAWLM